MSGALKVGDRVRVRVENHPDGHLKGDKGTALRVAKLGGTGTYHYLVAMDKDQPDATGIVFNGDEIEPDT
jgi:hypothetical protein